MEMRQKWKNPIMMKVKTKQMNRKCLAMVTLIDTHRLGELGVIAVQPITAVATKTGEMTHHPNHQPLRSIQARNMATKQAVILATQPVTINLTKKSKQTIRCRNQNRWTFYRVSVSMAEILAQ